MALRACRGAAVTDVRTPAPAVRFPEAARAPAPFERAAPVGAGLLAAPPRRAGPEEVCAGEPRPLPGAPDCAADTLADPAGGEPVPSLDTDPGCEPPDEPPPAAVGCTGTVGTGGAGTEGVVTPGVLTCGVVTFGVVSCGVVTGPTATLGTVTEGTVADGTLTVGTVTVGTDRVLAPREPAAPVAGATEAPTAIPARTTISLRKLLLTGPPPRPKRTA